MWKYFPFINFENPLYFWVRNNVPEAALPIISQTDLFWHFNSFGSIFNCIGQVYNFCGTILQYEVCTNNAVC